MLGMAPLGEMDARVPTVFRAGMDNAVGIAIVLGKATLLVGAPEGVLSKPP